MYLYNAMIDHMRHSGDVRHRVSKIGLDETEIDMYLEGEISVQSLLMLRGRVRHRMMSGAHNDILSLLPASAIADTRAVTVRAALTQNASRITKGFIRGTLNRSAAILNTDKAKALQKLGKENASISVAGTSAYLEHKGQCPPPPPPP